MQVEIEAWIPNILIGLVTLVATYAVLKRDVNELKRETKVIEKEMDEMKTAQHIFDNRIVSAPSMEQVRQEFVSKELFDIMKNHMDEKFQSLEKGQNKILVLVEKLTERG